MHEPRTSIYACAYCGYRDADLAGTSCIRFSPSVNILRVLCYERILPELRLRTFRKGADGALVLGRHLRDCHFHNPNHRTAKRIPILKRILEFSGIEPERLRLEWVSASEGERLAQVVDVLTPTIQHSPATAKVSKAA